ncbi:SigE family RNA polymerase sigma factor [Nocardioides acrostichi]|uniref:SigE family RNA polymerase sigma factor n=1 Tax=Nocardioides acrostichi TaxID=2784339 RepID=A0A930V1Q2_9ACTN|nr:SigE family RNA polymerase sigma factor [Nocardioides acrostichi]MBF4162120.1 SigE family RNA polymerase sigma factor [Nocardioides acrostichi]
MTDTDDFDHWVAAHWTRLVRTAVLLGCAPSRAEDVVQDALLRCLTKWRHVQRADNREAYVHRILVNAVATAHRPRKFRLVPTADTPDGHRPDDTHDVDTRDAIRRALAALPHDQCQAVVLRHYAHLTEAQMAMVLGVSSGTVKSRLSRAMKALRVDPHLSDLGGTR